MGRLFEELLVEQCAPTLTGLKPASLFRYQADDRIESVQAAVHWARELEPYGITVRVLKVCPKTVQASSICIEKQNCSACWQSQLF